MLNFEYEGTRLLTTPEGALDFGIPQDVIDETVAAHRATMIDAETSRRIEAHIPKAAMQSGMERSLVLLEKRVVLSITPAERAESDRLLEVKAWIDAMRAVGETLKGNNADYADDSHWPAFPSAQSVG